MIDNENFPVKSAEKLSPSGSTFVLGLTYSESRREFSSKSAVIFRQPFTSFSDQVSAEAIFNEFTESLAAKKEDWIAVIQRYIDHGPA